MVLPDDRKFDPEATASPSSLPDDVVSDTASSDAQVFEYDDSRKLGVTSSVFLILNKMIGTGSGYSQRGLRSYCSFTDPSFAVFSTPSGIFKATGSVGVSIILWVVGGIITFSGLSVYLEFGLVSLD